LAFDTCFVALTLHKGPTKTLDQPDPSEVEEPASYPVASGECEPADHHELNKKVF
jgi:hypothetical protein